MNILDCYIFHVFEFFIYVKSYILYYTIIYVMHLFYFIQRIVCYSVIFLRTDRIKKCVAKALVFIITSRLYINY